MAESTEGTHPVREPSPDLADLLARSARGDEDAWREIIGLYARRVFALARSRCRREELAEEITQSVFVTVASKLSAPDLPGGYIEQGRFESWLFRVTMNRVRDELRRESRHAQPTDPADLVDLRAAPDHKRQGAGERELIALRAAIDRLPEADRLIIELRHHAQMPFRAISLMLDEPLGTLLARHHRALRKLKGILEDAGVTGPAES